MDSINEITPKGKFARYIDMYTIINSLDLIISVVYHRLIENIYNRITIDIMTIGMLYFVCSASLLKLEE